MGWKAAGAGDPRGRPALTQQGVGQTCTSLLTLGFHWDPFYNDSDSLSLPSEPVLG